MDRSKYLTGIFHTVIITIFLLSFSACGYKTPPYYKKDAPKSDKNVEFILKHTNNDNNMSCK